MMSKIIYIDEEVMYNSGTDRKQRKTFISAAPLSATYRKIPISSFQDTGTVFANF